uniref:Uncharacterized protein n=1 Tax=Oryza nivara TaxID=4536 RepID=A0A0E0IYF3_ORYNI
MHGRFRGLGFRGGGGGCRSHRGGAAARTPSRLASGIAARWHRLRMCSTPPAGAGEVVRHPGADSLEMDRLHPRRHRRLKGEARDDILSGGSSCQILDWGSQNLWSVILNASNVVRRRSYSNKVQTAKVTDFYDCDPANPGQPFAPFLFFKRSKKRQ